MVVVGPPKLNQRRPPQIEIAQLELRFAVARLSAIAIELRGLAELLLSNRLSGLGQIVCIDCMGKAGAEDNEEGPSQADPKLTRCQMVSPLEAWRYSGTGMAQGHLPEPPQRHRELSAKFSGARTQIMVAAHGG